MEEADDEAVDHREDFEAEPVKRDEVCVDLVPRALCRIKLLPVTCFGGHVDVNC